MEKGQIFPGQSHYQETGFEAEEPQPYLEAKLYIERMEQERIQEEICEDGIHGPLPSEVPEPLEHGVSLTVYPIRVPSMHFTCATVQWDVPHTTAEASVDEINCREGTCLDWVVNPLSTDTPSMSQEDIIDLIPEKEHGQTDTVLPQEPAVSAKNKDNSSQAYHAQDLNENVCITSSNEKDKVLFKDTSQTSAASRDNGPATSENNVRIKDLEVQFCVESSDVFEEKNKETKGTALEASDEPVQAREKDSRMERCSEDGTNGGNLGGGSTENGQCDYEVAVDSTHHSRTAGHSLEQDDSQQTEEPDLMEKSDRAHAPSIADSPEEAEQLVKYAFGARQSIEEVDSERVVPKLKLEISQSEQLEITGNSEKSQQVIFVATLDMANDEMVQLEPLQHAETFVKLQESMQADRQEERTCSRHVESSAEMELPEDTKQLERPTRMEPSEQESQYNCSDKVECCEQSKHQEFSLDKTIIESFKQLECSFETDPTVRSNESKIMSEIEFSEQSKQSEFSVETEPLEHLNESDISSEELFKQSKQSSDPDNTGQTQSKQSPQLQHIEQQKFKQQQNEDEKPKEMTDRTVNSSGQTEQSISHHMCGPPEELERPKSVEPVAPYENGSTEVIDREQARRLAERLYRLENVQRTDVVQHLDKDNDFSRAVGEEYLKFFDFTDQSLDNALRSFLKEVVLIGETQERERVLERFSNRYHQCNPTTFSSAGAVLTLTCAVMLLNTDLHGQNVGKAMSMTDFVSNLNGMNDGKNFSKDLLKTFYNSIKNHQLEWAIEEKYLVKSMNLDPDSDQDASLRSKSNPFQDIAHDKKATVFQKGFLKRKAHADIDGKRTPWGKRSWKTFYAVLKGMVLYLQKDEYRKDWQSSEEVLSIHHTLAERAQDYTKRPHVFRLQTADWRVFLFEAASTEQMNSWIGRINLVSALYSSPPFPAAVGSQRKFCRPILPATQSALTLEKQLQSHTSSLQSFQEDLGALQQGAPDGRKAKGRGLEELRLREEYLQHERCRYEAYVRMLEVWQTISKSSETASGTDLNLFDQELWKGMPIEEEVYDEIEGGMKRSYSSPSLELEVAPPPMVKVRRNISERRTYRKIVIPRHNKEL